MGKKVCCPMPTMPGVNYAGRLLVNLRFKGSTCRRVAANHGQPSQRPGPATPIITGRKRKGRIPMASRAKIQAFSLFYVRAFWHSTPAAAYKIIS